MAFPYVICMPIDRETEQYDWCEEKFGPSRTVDPAGTWACLWAVFPNNPHPVNWHFQHEKDAVLFSLMWAS